MGLCVCGQGGGEAGVGFGVSVGAERIPARRNGRTGAREHGRMGEWVRLIPPLPPPQGEPDRTSPNCISVHDIRCFPCS